MEPIQLLERHYNAFIDLENPKDFFVGMADYFDFANSVPEFTPIADEILAPKHVFQEQMKTTGKVAIVKLAEVKEKLAKYVADNKIENASIKDAFRDYEGWLSGSITGSQSMPDAMYDALRDVVEYLNKLPEHKTYSEQFMEFSQDKTYVRHYLSVPEFTAFQLVEEDIHRESKTALWAQLDELSTLYNTIKTGRTRLRELTDKLKGENKNPLAWQVLNERIVVEDWNTVETGAGLPRLFRVSKIRPMMIRFHTNLLSRFASRALVRDAIDRITTTTPIDQKFKPRLTAKRVSKRTVGFLQLHDEDKPKEIAEVGSRQFLLIQCLFNSRNELKAEYAPVFQTYERVYEAVHLSKDEKNTLLKDSATRERAIRDIIEYSIKEIQKKKQIRGYLKFEMENARMRLQITLPEGDDKQN